ncbi:MAG TPA: penicillin-binding transpeptidase domain-containing protein, partial [Bryobacteraceae bacterium]|nr:penicillin-binding transpeptidase domain-containing protein [Bryobacteraceae bacterium]
MTVPRFVRAVHAVAIVALLTLVAGTLSAALGATAATVAHKHRKRHSGSAAAKKPTGPTHQAVTNLKPVENSRVVRRTRTRAAVIHTNTAPVTPGAFVRANRRRRVIASPWTEPTYADSTVGDSIDGEDLQVRKAAVDALGPYNGAVVVSDAQTGRILTIVNQKLALKGAFQPCSTVKVMVSLASLSEGLVDASMPMHITRRYAMDMTTALARSNNAFFAKLGEELGFERVEKYGKMFGLGEKAGLDIPGEEAGYLASEAPDSGVGMMTSFGDGIRVTPLELASVIETVASGGTMYYLQYPRSEEDIEHFVPRIKRVLDISNLVPSIRPGMEGAVEYGTARRANFDPGAPIFGKTGTCTDTAQPGVHLGWFGSFADYGKAKLVVVVLLTGGRG